MQMLQVECHFSHCPEVAATGFCMGTIKPHVCGTAGPPSAVMCNLHCTFDLHMVGTERGDLKIGWSSELANWLQVSQHSQRLCITGSRWRTAPDLWA